jgi:hypothetical protein
MESVITIFNGESEMVTTRKELMSKSATQVVELLQTTAVFRDILKDLDEDTDGIGLHSVVAINGIAPDRFLELQIERGYLALYDTLCYKLGEDAANLVIINIMNAINLEKCSD